MRNVERSVHPQTRFHWRDVAATLIAGSTVMLWARPAPGSYFRLDLPEIVHRADVIFIGTVTGSTSRKGLKGGMIFTDVTFAEIVTIHTKPWVAADISKGVSLAFAGGQIGDEQVTVSGVPHLMVGERYLIFSSFDGQAYASATIGGAQGVFRLMVDARTGKTYPLTLRRSGILSVTEGRLDLVSRIARIEDGVITRAPPPVEMAPAPMALSAGARDGVSRHESDPKSLLSLEEFIAEVRAALAAPPPPSLVLSAAQTASGDAAGREDPTGAAPDSNPSAGGGVVPKTLSRRAQADSGNLLCRCGHHNLNIVMEQVPGDDWSYEHNNDAMSQYNLFMDVYRVKDDDGSFDYHNLQNEFCGFPDDEVVFDVYGVHWRSDRLGRVKDYAAWPCGVILESDVMFNPEVLWYEELYRVVLMHELGHTWGLMIGECDETYDYDVPSVMHAADASVVEDGWGIHCQDATYLRLNYKDQTSVIHITDVGVEAYYASGGLRPSSTDKWDYLVGEEMTFENITVENMSDRETPGVRVRLWLSTDRSLTPDDYLVGVWGFEDPPLEAEVFWTGDLPGATVPLVPTGDYYVGASVTIGDDEYREDDFTLNNSTFLPDAIKITCGLPGWPRTVSASDGSYCWGVRVSWGSAYGADGYRVWRDSEPISDWQAALTFDDYSAVLGTTYAYRIQTRNECGETGVFSVGTPVDRGYRSPAGLPPPQVQASKGSYCNLVSVTWTSAEDELEYRVYRDGEPLSDWQSAISYDDNSVWPWQRPHETPTYNYQVKARNTCGEESDLSAADIGYPLPWRTPPDPPSGVMASDGVPSYAVLVTWEPSPRPSMIEYRVYRGGEPLSPWQSDTSYQDPGVVLGALYFYQVKARDICGESEPSTPDAGYIGKPPVEPSPPPPCSVAPAEGLALLAGLVALRLCRHRRPGRR